MIQIIRCHNLYMYTLYCVDGDKGHILGWIAAFLSSRFQSVKIDHFLSSPSYIKSGVSHGCISGSILSLIYIYDITDILLSDKQQFLKLLLQYRFMRFLVLVV